MGIRGLMVLEMGSSSTKAPLSFPKSVGVSEVFEWCDRGYTDKMG